MADNVAIESEVNQLLGRALKAAAVFSELDQEHTDRIVKAVHRVALDNRVKLAKMAFEETGIGKWEDKVIKNVVAAQFVYDDIKNLKTVGVISDNPRTGITEIAQPLGPIFGVIPSTNPTSTVIFKAMIALKTRNPIIFSFHPRAIKCCSETARLIYEAAMAEDAPEDCIIWMDHTSNELSGAIMKDRRLALILATGGEGLVRAAYSSGTPALGVGPGNVPVFIEKSADIPFAIDQVFTSKTFDNGTICASEQTMVVETAIAEQVAKEIQKHKGYFVADADIGKLEAVAFDKEKRLMRPDAVGKPARWLAQQAGIKVPDDTQLLLVRLKDIGKHNLFSCEKLMPILSFFVADGFDHAVKICIELNFLGGIGHTVSIFSNDDEQIKTFASLMNAGRIVVNVPSAQGAVGGIFNTLHPSFTLGCGTGGKNITTDNVTAHHLLNIQRIARRRVNERFGKFDASQYLDEKLSGDELDRRFNLNY